MQIIRKLLPVPFLSALEDQTKTFAGHAGHMTHHLICSADPPHIRFRSSLFWAVPH